MKNSLRDTFKTWVRNHIPIGRTSYSQEGEDLVLARLLGHRTTSGFYVDIGAHHPTRFSNTYYFYRRGWLGINVDAAPGIAALFKRARPRDIFVETGVGQMATTLPFHIFNEPALNTFSPTEAAEKAKGIYHIVKTVNVPVATMTSVLDAYLPPNTHIDFMSIDVEGLDFEVVTSNDWQRYHPDVVVVELLNTSLEGVRLHPTAMFLHDHGYTAVAKTLNSVFFMCNDCAALADQTPR